MRRHRRAQIRRSQEPFTFRPTAKIALVGNYQPKLKESTPDGGSRAIGTILDPQGKAFAAIAKGESYFGDADILGNPYITGYEPIRDASNNVIGIYYVGYSKQ